MKRYILAASALLALAVCVNAQRVLPASNPNGKLLSMQEAVFNRDIYPQGKAFHWENEHTLAEGPAKHKKSEYKLPESEEDGIVYGKIYSRNEFGITTGVFPSNSGGLLAVVRKDERAVSEFPLLDISTRTGSLVKFRYPMNGMDSEKLSLCVCDTLGNILSEIIPGDFTSERYLTGICWSPDDKYIFIQVVDRSQHKMALNMYKASDGGFVRTILREENPVWVEPLDPLFFIKDTYSFLYRTDNRDGYRKLYLCDTLGTVRLLTKADADVSYVGNDGKYVYYTSAEVSPVENHLFRIRIRNASNVRKAVFGKPERLTFEPGWHNVRLSPDCTQFLDTWSYLDTPRVIAQKDIKSGSSKVLYEAPDPLEDFARVEMEFGTVPSADGAFENYYRLYKPLNFDPSKKYPLLLYVYGGPHSQMVKDSWLGGVRMWEMLMAQRGYIVYVQDNRGTQNRGAAYEKAINRELGQVEMADQMVGIRRLMEQPWVDCERIGVCGWSYGGYMTIGLMTNFPEIFKVGVAGGPVIDWKWYEIMYGERYMDTEETNPEGFSKVSLLGRAKDLKGKLLICQGAVDNTVVWQHSLNFVQNCIEEGVQLDYFPYPLSEHNIAGEWRIHLYQKTTDYFDDWL